MTNTVRADVRFQDNCLVVRTVHHLLEKCYEDEAAALKDAKTLGWMDEAGFRGRGTSEARDILGAIQHVDLIELRLKGFQEKIKL